MDRQGCSSGAARVNLLQRGRSITTRHQRTTCSLRLGLRKQWQLSKLLHRADATHRQSIPVEWNVSLRSSRDLPERAELRLSPDVLWLLLPFAQFGNLRPVVRAEPEVTQPQPIA